VDIAGTQGQPVVAAADGKVVYAGSGLRGYGNLVIIQHNSSFLSAYGHNQRLLVNENAHNNGYKDGAHTRRGFAYHGNHPAVPGVAVPWRGYP